MLLTPPSCHKLSHLLGSPPLERDILYGWPLFTLAWDKTLILKLLIISQASMEEQNDADECLFQVR